MQHFILVFVHLGSDLLLSQFLLRAKLSVFRILGLVANIEPVVSGIREDVVGRPPAIDGGDFALIKRSKMLLSLRRGYALGSESRFREQLFLLLRSTADSEKPPARGRRRISSG
jgi:hypothetical protein